MFRAFIVFEHVARWMIVFIFGVAVNTRHSGQPMSTSMAGVEHPEVHLHVFSSVNEDVCSVDTDLCLKRLWMARTSMTVFQHSCGEAYADHR